MSTTRKSTITTLERLLANGPLDHLPSRGADLEALLALAAARFEPGKAYSEGEVNDALAQWLEPFADPAGLDHVSARRALVDARFLERDRAGTSYRVSTARLDRALERDAWSVEPAQVLEDVRRERAERKRRHA